MNGRPGDHVVDREPPSDAEPLRAASNRSHVPAPSPNGTTAEDENALAPVQAGARAAGPSYVPSSRADRPPDEASELFATIAAEAQSDALGAMGRVLSAVLELVRPADGATIELVGAEGWFVTVAAAGRTASQVGHVLSPRYSLAAATLHADCTLTCADARNDLRVDREFASRFGVSSLICLPLRHADAAIGVLAATSEETAAFSPADSELLEAVADLVSTLIGSSVQTVTSVEALVAKSSLQLAGAQGAPAPSLAGFAANALRPGLLGQAVARRRIVEVVSSRCIETLCQPIVELTSGRMVAVEALTRFPPEPARPTEEWFVEATAVGLSNELELAALEAALVVLPLLPAPVSLSVNVGPGLLTSDVLDAVLGAVPAERVVIELTEHTAVRDYPELESRLAGLRARGVRLAIDDTGAGISSLAHILRLSPDVIKLDRSLVAGVDTNAARRTLVGALVGFAAEIGAVLVAEGIETAAELGALQALGVALGQGFYLGRPTAIDLLFPLAGGAERQPARQEALCTLPACRPAG